MSLKSLVNKSVIKSDLRRYWWLGAIFAGWLFLTTAIPAQMVMNNDYYMSMNPDTHFVGSRFCSAVMASPLVIIAFCIIIPAMLYSYLHHKSAVREAHSLPLRRECLYFSHLFSAGVLIAAAIIINAGIMLTMVNTSAWFILIWMCLSLVYAFVTMAFSAAASMLVGNVAAGVVLPFIVMLLPLFFTAMLQELCTNYLYGYAAYDVFRWLNWVYMDYDSLLNGGAIWYIAIGIVFVILGLVFYKKRALENHSRILAFDVLNPIFMYGLAMCAGLAGYAYIYEIMNIGDSTKFSMWIGLPFGIAGIIIARMIIAKTFKPKGIIKPVIIYVAMMFVVYLFFGLDITGFEKRVPDIDKIESVNVVNLYDVVTESYSTGFNNERYYVADSAKHDYNIYDSGEIEKVIALHNALIESGESDQNHYYIPIIYTLSNGKTMRRQYHIDRNNAELHELYGAVQDLPPVKGERFPIISDAEIEYTGSNAENWGIDTWLTPERQSELLEALKKDVEASKFADYEFPYTLTSFHLNYRKPSVDKNNILVENKEKWYSGSIDYNIYPSYTNCIALLESWGLYNVKPSADDVARMDIQYIGEDGYRSGEARVNITDKAEIQKVLDHLEANAEHMSDAEYMSGDTQGFDINYNNSEWFSITAPKMAE